MFIRIKVPALERSGRLSLVETLKAVILIVASYALVTFVAGPGTLNRAFNQSWQASGILFEAFWGKVLDFFHDDELMIGTVGIVAFDFFLFWGLNLFFLFVDFLEWPSLILRYKIQPKQTFTMPEFWKAVRTIVFNQIVVALPFFYCNHLLMKWRGCSFTRELPPYRSILLDAVVFAVVEELGFYYTHRMVHLPFFYKHVHKKHHEWTAPIGIVSIYCHPFEFIVSNLAPICLGPLIMGSHSALLWFWLGFALFSTTVSHCGYHLPFLPSPEMHDFHHLKFTNCFGVSGLLDTLHGTDDMFRKSKQYARHYTYIGITPPRDLVPDEPKPKK